MNYVANQWEDGEKLDLEKYRNIEQGIVNIEAEKEALENKVIYIDENSTHTEYPSAKAVYEIYLKALGQDSYNMLFINTNNKVIGIFKSVPERVLIIN